MFAHHFMTLNFHVTRRSNVFMLMIVHSGFRILGWNRTSLGTSHNWRYSPRTYNTRNTC